MSDDPKPAGTITRVLGLVGGIAIGALVGAIAMALAGLAAEWQAYAGYVPSPTAGGFGGGAIGLALGFIFPEKCAYAFAWLIAS
jgi:hypothetical protein